MQCTDEDDVVDVGVMNHEGSCGATTEGCRAEEGRDPTKDIFGVPVFLPSEDSTHPHKPGCSDDGDAVDVGVLNQEGTYSDYLDCPPEQCGWATRGDEEDGVDVGALNRESMDDDDANDVGILNCEWSDYDDGSTSAS